jgi:hypothetical protein
MRSLRVVGITEDGSVVLEDSGRRERFTVPADEQLRAAARGDLTRLGQIAIELESQLRPREIQARIRAGASVDQVASAAGVPVEKIERFAYPVLLERTRTAELAQAAHPVREDGPDVRTLAETVAHTFGLRGQDHSEGDWDSWKGEDGKWVVALNWRSGRSVIRAHWAFQPGAHGGTVTALDDHARDLVEGRPQQPLRPVGPVIDMARPDDDAEATAAAVVPAAVNGVAAGDARRIAPEQRRGPLPGGRREPARGATRTEVRSEPAGPPTHPAARSTDTRATDTRADSATAGSGGSGGSGGSTGPERAGGREVVVREAAAPSPTRVGDPDVGRSGSAGSARAAQDDAPVSAVQAEVAPPFTTGQVVADRPGRERDSRAPGDTGGVQDVRAEPHAVGAAGASDEPGTSPAGGTAAAPAGDARSAGRAEGEHTPPAKRGKKGKPVMPSWDEVLLGVRGR